MAKEKIQEVLKGLEENKEFYDIYSENLKLIEESLRETGKIPHPGSQKAAIQLAPHVISLLIQDKTERQ